MRKIMLIVFAIILLPVMSFAQGLENYIIQNDIGNYKFRPKPTKRYYGNVGVVVSADHFDLDHDDITYETRYILPEPINGIDVQVTQHTGGDSDRWLLHELDRNFRNYYGLPSDSYVMRVINGNTIMAVRTGGGRYQWLSDNKVIFISYTDLQLTKPEPLEVVQAYLAKHPSTLAAMTSTDIRTNDNQKKWIKDEIDRRLWLCDKWNAQFQANKTTQKDLLYNFNRSIGVFLNYRQKYYGVSAKDDLAAIDGYMDNNDLTSIQTKLTEYKTWWNANKGKGISLP